MANTSFIDVSELLDSRHIINNDFMLATNNVALDEIDPYSVDLTDSEKDIIDIECEDNIWYFLREIVRIPDISETLGVQYNLTDKSLAQIWCCINNISSYTVKPAENYNSIDICVILIWIMLYDTTNPGIVINNKYYEGDIIFDTISAMVELLPAFMKERLIFDNDNSTISNNDTIVCSVSEYSISKANIISIRTENSNKISLYPDFEYMPVNTDLLTMNSKEHGYDIAISPPGNTNSRSCKDAIKMISESCKFQDFFYDLSLDKVHEYIINNSLNLLIYNGYPYIDARNLD